MRSDQTLHISILDTSRLQASNVIINIEPLNDLLIEATGQRSGVYTFEFLAFGVIEAPAFRTTSFIDFLKARDSAVFRRGYPDLEGALFRDDDSLETCVRIVRRIASHYGGELGLVVAVHLIPCARKHDDSKMYLQRLIGSFKVPEEWANDSTIMNVEKSQHYGYKESFAAAMTLRKLAIARAKSKLGGKKVPRETENELKSPEQMAKDAKEAEEAVNAVVSSPRVPEEARKKYSRWARELKGLKIEMNLGW